MNIACRYLSIVSAALLSVPVGDAFAQMRDRAQTTPAANADLATVAGGWAALAAGRHEDAIKAADAVLTRRPGDHRALDLKIEAVSAREPLRGLDAYETWLARTRIEDAFLLVPIARGILEQIAAGSDVALQKRALQRLAQDGDARAASRLQELAKTSAGSNSGASDLQRALDGDAAAAARLIEPKVAAGVPPQALAKALPAAGAAAVPALRALLKHPAAPVRMEAALSLGKVGAVDAIADLKPMLNDPEVRAYAAVALTRLGDADSENIVQEMLQSPVLDMRLLGAQAYEGTGPGPWVQSLMPALQDPNGVTRVRAAELLAPVAPEAALPVLMEAAKDPNPVVRADVMRVLERTELLAPPQQPVDAIPGPENDSKTGLASLRRMLRDPDATTRLHAAGSILHLVKGGR